MPMSEIELGRRGCGLHSVTEVTSDSASSTGVEEAEFENPPSALKLNIAQFTIFLLIFMK